MLAPSARFPGDGTMGDIVTIEGVGPVKPRHSAVGQVARLVDRRAQGGHAEHSAPGGNHTSCLLGGAGMEDLAAARLCGLEPLDGIRLAIAPRIAPGRHHHPHGGPRVPLAHLAGKSADGKIVSEAVKAKPQ